MGGYMRCGASSAAAAAVTCAVVVLRWHPVCITGVLQELT
jgi:hypothetical protein